MRHLVCAVLLAVGALGCEVPSESMLRVRAAYDLNCDTDAIHVTLIDYLTRAVRGCGQRAMYIHSCQAVGDCTWVMNSDIRRVADDSE
jgi:hypothetical protein